MPAWERYGPPLPYNWNRQVHPEDIEDLINEEFDMCDEIDMDIGEDDDPFCEQTEEEHTKTDSTIL